MIPTTRLALGLLVVVLVATGYAQERVEGNVYRNDRYGIEIAKPGDWHFLTAGMVVDLARRSGAGPKGATGDDPVKLAGFAVIVSKSPSLGGVVEPQVVVLVREAPARQTAAQACEQLPAGMLDPEIVAPAREVQLVGMTGVRLEFRGVVDGAHVQAVAVCARRGPHAITAVGQVQVSDFEREAPAFERILAAFRVR